MTSTLNRQSYFSGTPVLAGIDDHGVMTVIAVGPDPYDPAAPNVATAQRVLAATGR
jgi:hypothetical protein